MPLWDMERNRGRVHLYFRSIADVLSSAFLLRLLTPTPTPTLTPT